MLRKLVALLCVFAVTSVTAKQRCTDDSVDCTLGIFPHTSVLQIEVTYGSLAEDLSLFLDIPIRLVSSSSMTKYLKNLRQNKYDIALAGPLQYINDAKPYGYLPLARRNSSFEFEFITLKKSNINTMNDFVGKKMGLISESIENHKIASKLLRDKGISSTDIAFKQYPNQRACMHALVSRLTDICGTISTISRIIMQEHSVEFKVIAKSDSLPNAVFVVHPDVPQEHREELLEYFSGRGNYIPVVDSDYDVVRRLHE